MPIKTPEVSFPTFHCSHSSSTTSPSTSTSIPNPSTSLLPPSCPSSSYDLHPLSHLYFCDHCDAIRCPSCVVEEVTTYFCPNCLFEVSSGSVRAEQNRCSRNCLICPTPSCSSILSIQTLDPSNPSSEPTITTVPPTSSTSGAMPDAPGPGTKYVLYCMACRWSSASLGKDWEFEKATGIAYQVMEREKLSQDHTEYDLLQTHFDKYLHDLRSALGHTSTTTNPTNPSLSNSSSSTTTTTTRKPTRHTASAALKISSARKVSDSRFLAKQVDRINRPKKPKILPMVKSEDLGEYGVGRSWVGVGEKEDEGGLSREEGLVDSLRRFDGLDLTKPSPPPLTSLWTNPTPLVSPSHLLPTRVPLLGKLTKRCLTCNHTLIRPESKASSLRYKIKILAGTYVPGVEVGNRRRLLEKDAGGAGAGVGDGGKSLRRVSGLGMGTGRGLGAGMEEEREGLHLPLKRNTMPSPTPSSTPPPSPSHISPPSPSHYLLTLPDTTFDLSAFSEPWDIVPTEPLSGEMDAMERLRQRARNKNNGNGNGGTVERLGNVTKVGVWLSLGGGGGEGGTGRGKVEVDLDVGFRYRVEEEVGVEGVGGVKGKEGEGEGEGEKKDGEWKTFQFQIRVLLGEVEEESKSA